MQSLAVEAYSRAADVLSQTALAHKRAVWHHRRELAAAMARLADLRAECDRLGIDIPITQAERRPQ